MEHDTNPHPTAHDVDLQVIGAGLAGLLAANLATDAGLSVRLIEQHDHPGGRAASADHHGYILNLGPHALYLDGELRRALVGLGLDPAGTAPELAGATGSVGERVGLLPGAPASLLSTRLLSARSKIQLAAFMARLPRLDPEPLASTTVDAWLDDLTDRADLRAVLTGLVNLTTYNPLHDEASADAALTQLRMGVDPGVIYLDGGWRSVVRSLSRRANGSGVGRLAAKVTAVESLASTSGLDAAGATGPGGIVVTTADGARLLSRACVVAVGGPGLTDRLLGLDGHHTGQAGPTVEASVLDLGLIRRPTVGVHLGLDRRLYGTVHSGADGLAPPDRHLLTTALYRRPDDPGPDPTRATLLAHAEAMGVDRSDIEMQRYLHRLTVANGTPVARRGGLAGRPPVGVAERPGVFVAGDWVGPRGLLADASAASAVDAVAAARRLLGSRSGAIAAARSPRTGSRARLVGS